jgi:beta-lactamase class A
MKPTGEDLMNLKEKILATIADGDIDFGIALKHIESGEQILINEEMPYPTASVMKVPVMVEVFKQARARKFDLNDRLTLQSKYKTLTTGVLLQLQDGLQPSIRDLMMLMIIVSDNVATSMLMELVGPENVTATMHALGLKSIYVNLNVHEMFLHAWGIPERTDISVEELRQIAKNEQMDYNSRTFSRGSDNCVSSASDMTELMTLIYKGEVVDREACDEMLAILSHQQYNNRVPLYLPWYSTYHKTGTMRGVRADSGIIYCTLESHVAFTVFSFDHVTLPLSEPKFGTQRSMQVAEMMGEIGLAAYQHFGGEF